PFPLGASVEGNRVNFALVSSHAITLSLCLFDPANRQQPLYEIPFYPPRHRTGDVWHMALDSLPLDLLYLYRINDQEPLLSDPYAKGIETTNRWGAKSNQPYLPFGAIVPPEPFDWGEDAPLRIPLNQLIIYEMHVRGFTQDSSSRVQTPGT